jgi:hypothetical protein
MHMKSKIVVLAVVAGALLWGIAAYGHHSFASTYDLKKVVKIEGKLVQFLFRNPHSFVHVEATDADGQVKRWSIEWAGGGLLSESSITGTTLKVGDPVIITGNPTRTSGEPRLRMVTFKRTSDGLEWGTRRGEVVD